MASMKKAGTVTPNVVSFPTTAAATPAPIMFGSLIKERRKKAKLSQKDFADMMHVTRNTVINWEADKSKPDYSLIPEVCSLLNIQIHELFHMQAENGLSDLEDRVVGNIRLLNPTSRRVVDKMISTMVEEELLAKDKALKETFSLFLKRPGSVAAGVGNYVPEEAPEYVFLRKNHINAKADGIALVDGKSMEPVYHDGDYVYYEEASCADPGEDVLVDTDDGAVIKRVDDDHTLYSVNPAIPYPKKSDQNTLVIRGRVLGVVASSDRPSKDDVGILEELFVDEIREFNEEHGVNE
ncbi:MAG: transcriptional repressor DicA [Candidatus Hydrogenedentes bacterium ADurb.Bin170]|nr:MAG: transcriptional repressor DicA [Candidatus Hydrogenedentes bacterium ADurb.Bin170]